MRKPKLSEEDKQRVKDYLENNPLHSQERERFKVWRLVFLFVAFVSIIGFFSLMLGRYYFYA